MPREVSRGRSTGQRAGKNPEDSMSGRAELANEHSTAERTLGPMTPDRVRFPMSALLTGSMECSMRGLWIMSCVWGQPWLLCRNRRTRTRMSGDVGAGAGLLGQSPATRLAESSVRIFSVVYRQDKDDLFLIVYGVE